MMTVSCPVISFRSENTKRKVYHKGGGFEDRMQEIKSKAPITHDYFVFKRGLRICSRLKPKSTNASPVNNRNAIGSRTQKRDP